MKNKNKNNVNLVTLLVTPGDAINAKENCVETVLFIFNISISVTQ